MPGKMSKGNPKPKPKPKPSGGKPFMSTADYEKYLAGLWGKPNPQNKPKGKSRGR
jgi:hypothetical protein